MFIVIVHLYACASSKIMVGLVRKIVNRVMSATGQVTPGHWAINHVLMMVLDQLSIAYFAWPATALTICNR